MQAIEILVESEVDMGANAWPDVYDQLHTHGYVEQMLKVWGMSGLPTFYMSGFGTRQAKIHIVGTPPVKKQQFKVILYVIERDLEYVYFTFTVAPAAQSSATP